MPSVRVPVALLLVARSARGADDIAFDIVSGGDSFYVNEGGSMGFVGGLLGGRPVMCYRDYANPMAASLTCSLLASTSAADLSEGASVVVSSENSPSTSFAELDSTAGVVCYAAYGRSAGSPTCNVVSFEESDIQAGPDVIVDEGLSSDEQSTYVELTTVAGLSSTAAVMCYRTKDGVNTDGILRCAALTRTGSELEVSSTVILNSAFTKGASVVGFSESTAMVCFSDNLDDQVGPAEDYRGFCVVLSITAGTVTVPNFEGSYPIQLWEPVAATFARSVVAQSLSADTALVCFSRGSGSSGVVGGDCIYVEVANSTVTKLAELPIAAGAMSHMALEKFSDETAVLCYMTDTQGTCVEMYASGRGSAAQLIKGNPLVLEDARIDQVPAISSVSGEDGVVCYTEIGSGSNLEWGKCVPVEVTPTSTSTGTDTSSTPHTTTESSSTTGTSSTTPHTTTGTSSTTTGTSSTTATETSTTGTSSTTPHTTTGTSSTTETATATTETTATVTATTTSQTTAEQVVDSGAIRIAGACAPVAVLLVAHLLN